MDYKNGKIYKIVDNGYNKMYIGSTTQPLYKRFSEHKCKYKQFKNGKSSKITVYDIFDEFEIVNCKIELIEEYQCENKAQLERKEGEHIKINECVNRCIPGRTRKDYYNDNKEKEYAQKKIWFQNNKDKEKIYRRRKYIKNKEEENIKNKIYYEKNKQEINKKRNEKTNCECGGIYSNNHKSRHMESKIHINFVK